MDVPYDHRENAGNEGDVVKHVALIAALDSHLKRHDPLEFRYADTFAGPAYSTLATDGGWEDGIKQIWQNANLALNPHTRFWQEWYLLGRNQLLGEV